MVRNKFKTRLVFGVAAVGMLLLTSACQTDNSSDKDFFPADNDSAVKKISDAQAAAGAQDDATLYPAQFDGSELNSLGQSKLDLITSTLPDNGPVTIYLEAATGSKVSPEVAKARTTAVTQYLLNSHLTDDQFKLVDGANMNLSTASGSALANYSKTDTGEASNQTGTDASQAASASAAGH